MFASLQSPAVPTDGRNIPSPSPGAEYVDAQPAGIAQLDMPETSKKLARDRRCV